MFLLYEFDLKDQSTPLYTIVNLSGKPLIKIRIKDISDDYYHVREKILKVLIKTKVINENTGIKWAIYGEEIMVTFIDLRYILDKINEEEQYKSIYEIMVIHIYDDLIMFQDITEYLRHLRGLYLKDINMPDCELSRLTNLYRLEILRLTDPPVIIPPEFSKLEHLHTLLIDSQELTYIPENLSIISNLSKLNLSYNKLNQISPSLFQLHKLEALNLNNNRLTNIPDEITQLTRLMYLNVSYNNITQYSGCINKIHTLKELVYAGNNLTEISNIKLPNLERLDLKQNKIVKCISNSINLTNLKKLELCYNKLVEFPDFIYNLKCLEHLDIGNFDNDIKDIKSDLYDIISLKYLYIRASQNDQSIPSNIGKLTNLLYLDIRGRGHSIPNEIMNLGLLKLLYILQPQFNTMSEKMKLALKEKIYDYEGLQKRKYENIKYNIQYI